MQRKGIIILLLSNHLNRRFHSAAWPEATRSLDGSHQHPKNQQHAFAGGSQHLLTHSDAAAWPRHRSLSHTAASTGQHTPVH